MTSYDTTAQLHWYAMRMMRVLNEERQREVEVKVEGEVEVEKGRERGRFF